MIEEGNALEKEAEVHLLNIFHSQPVLNKIQIYL